MMTVVLVDDRKDFVQGILSAVDWAGRGIEAYGFYNGADALAFCLEQSPDLVITDIRMPFMTGLELAGALHDRGSTARVVLLTGYEDFAYAREGLRLGVVEYLTKPVRIEAIEALLDRETKIAAERHASAQAQVEEWRRYQRSLPALRRQWAQAQLQGEAANPINLSRDFSEMGFALVPARLLVGIVELVFEGEPPDPDSLYLDRYAVENIGCEILGGRYPCAGIDLGGMRVAFLLNYPEQERPLSVTYHAGELFTRLAERCADILHLGLASGIGSCVDTPEALQAGWQDARRALEQNFFTAQPTVFSVLEVPKETDQWQQHYPEALQDEAVRALRRRDIDAAEHAMQALFDALAELTEAPPARLRERLLSFLLRIFHECGLEQYLQVANALEQFQNQRTLSDLREWFSCLGSYLQAQIDHATAPVTEGVRKVQRYIEQHYAEPITLKAMAQLAYLSPAYLSFSFKEVVGVNFNEYLTNVRMEHAKALLASRQYRVYEVCEMVGYHDKKYFSDLFKRHTGVFPKEWR